MKLTDKQLELISKLQWHENNRVIEYPDVMTKRVRYIVQLFGYEKNTMSYESLHSNTVRGLLDKDILIRENGTDILVLNKENS